MNKNEIINEYRQAKNKRAQIDILAELNAVPKERIEAILAEGGVELPKRPGPKAAGGAKPVARQAHAPSVINVLRNELAKLEDAEACIPDQIRKLQEQLACIGEKREAVKRALDIVCSAYVLKEDTQR